MDCHEDLTLAATDRSNVYPLRPEQIDQSILVFGASVDAPAAQEKSVLDELKISTCDQVGRSVR